jgi:hypothetical protein
LPLSCPSGPKFVEPIGDRLEVVVEQVGVHVEGHRRLRVPEHPLYRLYVRAGGHGQAHRGVTQLVRVQTRRHTGRLDRLVEPRPARSAHAQNRTLRDDTAVENCVRQAVADASQRHGRENAETQQVRLCPVISTRPSASRGVESYVATPPASDG